MSKQIEITAKDQERAEATGLICLKQGVVLMSRDFAISKAQGSTSNLVEMPDFAAAPFWVSSCGIAGAMPVDRLDADMIDIWGFD